MAVVISLTLLSVHIRSRLAVFNTHATAIELSEKYKTSETFPFNAFCTTSEASAARRIASSSFRGIVLRMSFDRA